MRAVAESTPLTPTNIAGLARMSLADIDVPRQVLQKELLRPPTIIPIYMGWHTQLTACRAHEPQAPNAYRKSGEHRIRLPRNDTNTCSCSRWWSVFDLVTGSAGRRL